MYFNWSGRYAAMFAVAVTAAAANWLPTGFTYGLSLSLALALFAWGCLRYSRLMYKDGETNLPLASVMFCGILLLVPSKLEQYLWLTGAAVYFVGGAALLILLQLVSASKGTTSKDRSMELQIGLLIVSVVGFNEFLALVVGMVLATDILLKAVFKADHTSWKRYAIRIAVFLTSFGTSILAPGNFVRDATSNAHKRDLLYALGKSSGEMMQYLLATASRDYWAIIALLFAAFLAGALAAGDRQVSFKRWGVSALILIAAFPMHFLVYTFLTGESTPGRVINQAVMLALAGMCIIVAAYGKGAVPKTESSNQRQIAFWCGFFAVGVLLLCSPNFRTLAQTTLRFGPSWHAQQIERDRGFASLPANNRQVVFVRAFDVEDSNPPIFAGGDVSRQPDNWINKCVASYYVVPEVKLYQGKAR